MGGCRCSFRDCSIGTSQHPGMHFFHFPINDRERYIRWLSLANAMHFLEMPISFQKNRVVCARHFRVECFKHYKRDRIIANKSVEPTLVRLNEDTALDYANEETDGGPIMIKIPTCTMKHLIPPPGYSFPFSLHDNLIPSEYIKKKNIVLGKSSGKRGSQNEKRSREDAIPSGDTVNAKKFKILNCESLNTSINVDEMALTETTISLNFDDTGSILDVPLISMENILGDEADMEKEDSVDQYEIDILDNCIDDATVEETDDDQQCEDLIKQLQDKEAKRNQETTKLSERIQELEKELAKYKEELKVKTNALHKNQLELKKVNIKLKDVLPHFEKLDANYNKLKDRNETVTKENIRLVEENRKLLERWEEYEKQRKEKEVEPVITSEATSSVSAENCNACRRKPTTVVNSIPNSLSKAQLFNGVRKYTSPSMAALLRMEMFGNADREWKPDEQRVAMDLLQLGHQVYQYIGDEWRFRLPPLGEVRMWLANATNSFDYEEDL